jgi:hypothetical protein
MFMPKEFPTIEQLRHVTPRDPKADKHQVPNIHGKLTMEEKMINSIDINHKKPQTKCCQGVNISTS